MANASIEVFVAIVISITLGVIFGLLLAESVSQSSTEHLISYTQEQFWENQELTQELIYYKHQYFACVKGEVDNGVQVEILR